MYHVHGILMRLHFVAGKGNNRGYRCGQSFNFRSDMRRMLFEGVKNCHAVKNVPARGIDADTDIFCLDGSEITD